MVFAILITKMMKKNIGFLGILVSDRKSATEINTILSKHGDAILGRMGMYASDKKCWVISLIVDIAVPHAPNMLKALQKMKGVELCPCACSVDDSCKDSTCCCSTGSCSVDKAPAKKAPAKKPAAKKPVTKR